MRVRLVFENINTGAVVPYFHQDQIDNLISDILSLNPNLKDFKSYTFSGLKGQTELTKYGMVYNSQKVTIVLSSSHSEFIDFFVSEFLSRKYYSVGDLMLSPLSVDVEIMSFEPTMEVKYICISPLVLFDLQIDERLEFIDPFQDTFSDVLYESTLLRMETAGYNVDEIPNIHKFQIIPDKEFMNRFTGDDRKYARIHTMVLNGNRVEIRTYSFPFTLYAAPDVHKFIFDCGLGEMTTHGLGMLDVVGKKKINTRPYSLSKSQL